MMIVYIVMIWVEEKSVLFYFLLEKILGFFFGFLGYFRILCFLVSLEIKRMSLVKKLIC